MSEFAVALESVRVCLRFACCSIRVVFGSAWYWFGNILVCNLETFGVYDVFEVSWDQFRVNFGATFPKLAPFN